MLDDGQSRTNSDDNIVSLMESGCSSVGEGGAGPSEPNLENRSISVSFKNGREADLSNYIYLKLFYVMFVKLHNYRVITVQKGLDIFSKLRLLHVLKVTAEVSVH